VSYTRDLTKLLFRSLFGCGVICGLKVTGGQSSAGKLQITVAKGLALDCMGNPIELEENVVVEYAPESCDFQFPIWIVVCYKEKCCRPKDVACSQDDDASPRPTRVQSGYEVRLYSTLPSCACRCPGVDDDPPAQPPADRCCEDAQTAAAAAPAASNIRSDRSTVRGRICTCYQPHFDGKCECDCNCCCVVLAKATALPTTDSQGNPIAMADRELTLVDTMVRRIRPMLNGYFQCPQAEKSQQGDGSEDPAETDQRGHGVAETGPLHRVEVAPWPQAFVPEPAEQQRPEMAVIPAEAEQEPQN
jgi:hypothetical protein